MKTKTTKRIIAGILAMSMCATATPITTIAVDETPPAAPDKTVAMTYAEMLEQLSAVEDCLSLPYFMVSEGDSVYINGEKVATTTVEVDRNLAFSGEAKKYWLDATAFGSYATLEDAAKRLNTYIDSTRAEVQTAEKNLTDVICAVREYCLANNLAKHNVSGTDAYKKLTERIVKIPTNVQVVRPESAQETATKAAESATTSTTATTVPITYADATALQGTGSKGEYDLVEKLMGARINADLTNYISIDAEPVCENPYNADGTLNNDVASMYALGHNVPVYVAALMQETAKYSETFGKTLTELFGDSSITTADWLAERLETQSAEDLAYACAVISSNLKLINTYEYYLTEKVYSFYDVTGKVIANMTLQEYFDFLAEYEYVTPIETASSASEDNDEFKEMNAEMEDALSDTVYNSLTRKYSVNAADVDTSKTTYSTAYTDADSIVSALTGIRVNTDVFTELDVFAAKLCTITYADYVNSDDNVYNYTTSTYVKNTANTVDSTIDSAGVLKIRNDKRNSVILNMPDDLVTAWYTFYDVSMGYDAFTEPADPTVFKSVFDERKSVVDGDWDFGATKYDAVKYVTESTEVNGITAEKKVALTDAEGNQKHYGKQNEVTPWINWQYLATNDSADTDNLNSEISTNANARVYAAYAVWATHETYRNVKDPNLDEEWYGPCHPEKYTVSNSPDMTAMLKEKGYEVDGSEEFTCTGMRINVSRFAMDAAGSDALDVCTYYVDFAEHPETRYNLDITNWLDQLYVDEAASVPADAVNSFMDMLAYLKPELNDQMRETYKQAYVRYLSGLNAHNGFAYTIDYIYECNDLAYAADSGLTNLAGVNKVLLTEIPEYSISEYYEDKTNLFKLTDVRSDLFSADNPSYANMYNLFAENPAKLYNDDTDNYGFTVNNPTSWYKQLERYAMNRSLGYVGSRFTVPTGYSVTLPAYIPVSGRTVDTRYFVRYVPDTHTGFPTPNNSAYYAVDMTANIGPDVASLASVTANGAPTFRSLTVADDKTPYYTVFYALDRGIKTVSALQRVMQPVIPFVVTGSTAQNMNNGLTVGDNASTENGYQGATFGAAAAEQGLPTLVWDNTTGNIINQYTQDATYSGDIHVWVSKSSAKDGIIAADWVNDVPAVLKDAIVATNTDTGVYDPTVPTVSVERPSTATAGNPVTIKSGVTTGTFADWAFKRTLTKSKMPYCNTCQKFVADATHHHTLDYTYCKQTATTTQRTWYETVTIPAGKTSTTGKGTTIPPKTKDPSTGEKVNVTKGTADKMKDFSTLPITGTGGNNKNLTGAEVQEKNALIPTGGDTYALGGFTWQNGVNFQETRAVINAIAKGADIKVGDTVHCFSYDSITGKVIDTPIVVNGCMVAQGNHLGGSTSSSGTPSTTPTGPSGTTTISVPHTETVTTITYSMMPATYTVCKGDYIYVDVWALNVGNSPYTVTDGVVNGATWPTAVTAPGTYNGIVYDYTVPTGGAGANVFSQVVDAHSSHSDSASASTPATQKSLATINARRFGVCDIDDTKVVGVCELEDLDALYNSAKKDSVSSALVSTAHKRTLKTYRDIMIVNLTNWYSYISTLVGDASATDTTTTNAINATDAKFNPTTQERLEKAVRTFNTSADVKLASVNAIVCPSLGINVSKNETFADVTETPTDGTKGTVTVKLPELKYVPYTIINNINGVTKSVDDLDYSITGITKTPRYDIFGIALDPHAYRTEQYASQYKTNLIPEVLMTYKDSFLDESVNLLDYNDRGALNSLYIAGYNKYSMDLPMYNKATLTYDFNATDFDTVGAATAKGTNASKLTTLADVLYTGTEVSTVADTDKTPSIDFKSYVLDFANPNIGTAWNPDYTADTAYRQVQDWLNTYKEQNAADTDSFEYTANLAVTYSKESAYQQTSNAVNGSTSSTITVDGKQMKPIEVTQQYSFDLTNSDGANNTYALLAQYPVTIRNGRLATVSVDGRTYVLYGDGNITTTEQLIASTGFTKLKADHYDVAEALANMKLPEFASTLTHNGGNQNWKTYEGTSIYTDNTTKTVVDEVGEERTAYDPNYANDAGWYSEDTTVLTIKLYGIDGDIDDHYAFTYKIPLDYGYNSPKNKADLFKAGTAIYAYNEMYFRFENTALNADGAVSGTYDITGDEGANNLANKPEIAYVISNATVNDMTR